MSLPYVLQMFPASKPTLLGEWARTGTQRGMANFPHFVDATGGDIIVTEFDNHKLQIFDKHANESRFMPFGTRGNGVNQFLHPSGVVSTNIPGSQIIVADTGNKRVCCLSIGTSKTGYGVLQFEHAFGEQLFDEPLGIDVDRIRNVLYVADRAKKRVTIHALTNGHLLGTIGPPSLSDEDFDPPLQITNQFKDQSKDDPLDRLRGSKTNIEKGNMFRLERRQPSNERFGTTTLKQDGVGLRLVTASTLDRYWKPAKLGEEEKAKPECGDNVLLGPVDVAFSHSGHLYVSDPSANCISVFEANGNFLFKFGQDILNCPWGICFDRDSNLIVADEGNNRVLLFSGGGHMLREIATDIKQPKGVSVSVHDNLVVTTADPYAFVKIIKFK